MGKRKQELVFHRLLSELEQVLSTAEYERVLQMEGFQQRLYVYSYYKEHYPNTKLQKRKESYNMDGAVALFAKRFHITAFAHNNLLYVQEMAHLKLPQTHYTTREGMESYMLLETVGGSGSIEYAGKTQQVHKGDVAFLDCRKNHHYEAGARGWEYRVIHYNGGTLRGLFDKIELAGSFVLENEKSREIRKALDQLFELNQGELNEKCEIRNNGILMQIMTEILLTVPEQSEDVPQWITDICAYLDVHFQSNILDSLEKEFYRNKYYICHAFKAHMGISISQYQTTARLQTAQSLLLSSKLSLVEIAVLIGYENVNSFDKAFKKKYGIPPGMYRKNRGSALI